MKRLKLQVWFLIGVVLLGLACAPHKTDSSTTAALQIGAQTATTSSLTPGAQSASKDVVQNASSQHFAVTVHYIDVGQADSILIKAGQASMLIDAGNNDDAAFITQYLKSQGVTSLDYVIGTHPHEDHYGALDNVIKEFQVKNIILPKVAADTKTYHDVEAAVQEKHLKPIAPVPGTHYKLGPADFEILAPTETNYEDLNDWSVVVKLVYQDTSFLFMGDAERYSEDKILAKGFDLSANVIKIGHHGSSSSTSPEFFNAVKPQYAIISVGKNNDYGLPSAQTMNFLKEEHIPVYRTDESGTIVATSDGKRIAFNTDQDSYNPGAVAIKSASSTNEAGKIVYITKSGTKYHADGCRFLSESKIPIKLSEAKAKGYKPCSVCKP